MPGTLGDVEVADATRSVPVSTLTKCLAIAGFWWQRRQEHETGIVEDVCEFMPVVWYEELGVCCSHECFEPRDEDASCGEGGRISKRWIAEASPADCRERRFYDGDLEKRCEPRCVALLAARGFGNASPRIGQMTEFASDGEKINNERLRESAGRSAQEE